jgi:hypothetical protein
MNKLLNSVYTENKIFGSETITPDLRQETYLEYEQLKNYNFYNLFIKVIFLCNNIEIQLKF